MKAVFLIAKKIKLKEKEKLKKKKILMATKSIKAPRGFHWMKRKVVNTLNERFI